MEQPHKSAEQIETAKKNSRLGIASFAVTMIVWGLAIILLVVSAAYQGYPFGFEFPLFFIGSVVGLALGIAGVMQKGRTKTYSILGIVFSSIVVIGCGILNLVIEITGY